MIQGVVILAVHIVSAVMLIHMVVVLLIHVVVVMVWIVNVVLLTRDDDPVGVPFLPRENDPCSSGESRALTRLILLTLSVHDAIIDDENTAT